MEIAPSYVTGALLRGGQRRKTYPGEERAVGRPPVRSAALQCVALYDAAPIRKTRSCNKHLIRVETPELQPLESGDFYFGNQKIIGR